MTVADDQAQAEYVVAHVLEARERGVALKRQAVLFRSSHHSDVLELELVRRNIPYVKYGGLKFLEAAHVKDLLAVLRWADNPEEPRQRVSRAAAPARDGTGERRALFHSFRSRRSCLALAHCVLPRRHSPPSPGPRSRELMCALGLRRRALGGAGGPRARMV